MTALNRALGEGQVLLRMLRGVPRGGSHVERLQGLYAPQAEHYDAFRSRLLHGREELITLLELEPGMRVVELGCGTGASLGFLGATLDGLARYDMVDLCPALLAQARRRAGERRNVAVHEADATTWSPLQAADRVLISYALTMIPDWRQAVANAHAMLAPGGLLGVVDFHLPRGGRLNGFWRRWFAHDGVHLSAEHLTVLRESLPDHWHTERRAAMPYLPIAAPYYLFIGRRE